MVAPHREKFRELARRHAVVPVWRELLADLTTPVSLFARCVGDGEGFLLESVDRGETWGRWSFIGRNPSTTLTSIGGALQVDGDLPDGVRTEDGLLVALEDLLERFRSPDIEGLPPLHGGLIGYLGYDVVREVEHLPNVPHDDRGLPDGVMSVIGELVAIDHWRQRAMLLVNVIIPEGADDAALDAAYDAAMDRLEALAADGARPLNEPLMLPPDPNEELPEVTFVKIMGDTDLESRALMKEWGVRVVPLFLLFRNGERIGEWSGAKADILKENVRAACNDDEK